MFKSVNLSNLGQVSKSNIVLIYILKCMLLHITPNMDTPYADVDVAIFEIADTLLFQSSVFASRYPQASFKKWLTLPFPIFLFPDFGDLFDEDDTT